MGHTFNTYSSCSFWQTICEHWKRNGRQNCVFALDKAVHFDNCFHASNGCLSKLRVKKEARPKANEEIKTNPNQGFDKTSVLVCNAVSLWQQNKQVGIMCKSSKLWNKVRFLAQTLRENNKRWNSQCARSVKEHMNFFRHKAIWNYAK